MSVGIIAADSNHRCFMAVSCTVSISPRPCAYAIMKRAPRLYRKLAEEPRATSVSILVEPCSTAPNPWVKNFLLIYKITIHRSIWSMPMQT